jgi:hypothetical protein
MTKTDIKIKNVVIGDAIRIVRTYTGLPSGATVSKAYLTCKKKLTLVDADALFQKEITASSSADGHVTDATSTDGQIGMYFDIAEADTTSAKALTNYYYDVQIELSGGETHTLEIGTIGFIKGVTDAQS